MSVANNMKYICVEFSRDGKSIYFPMLRDPVQPQHGVSRSQQRRCYNKARNNVIRQHNISKHNVVWKSDRQREGCVAVIVIKYAETDTHYRSNRICILYNLGLPLVSGFRVCPISSCWSTKLYLGHWTHGNVRQVEISVTSLLPRTM
jgi:hypothetical protein